MENVKEIAIIGFTQTAINLGIKLMEKLENRGKACEIYVMPKFSSDAKKGVVQELDIPLSLWTKRAFKEKDAIIFISATGIAVRSIAPNLEDKMTDPCVISIDEFGNYVIPLLSGHVGGGNDLALEIAEILAATAVISTATDLNGKFAIDEWAKKQNLHISDRAVAKKISVEILEGGSIGFKSEFPIEGNPPECISFKSDIGIYIGLRKLSPFKVTLCLEPKILSLGIGCRKGIDAEEIEKFVEDELLKLDLSMSMVENISSIDLKADEVGLLDFSKKYKIPLFIYTVEELSKLEGEFTKSEFVYKTVGIDNVCERCALLASKGRLILKKQKGNGVTLAIAIREPIIKWGADKK